MTRIALAGATGRMGKEILRQIFLSTGFECAGAFSHRDSNEYGRDVGQLVSQNNTGVVVEGEEKLFDRLADADVLIDFSVVSSLPLHIAAAVKAKKPMVIGLTGLSAENLQQVAVAAEQIPIMHEANYSGAMHVLFELAGMAAKLLPQNEFDVEIFEAHHRGKRDTPSGTALQVAKAIEHNKNIPIHAVRAGGIVGDHTVIFAASGERLELKHQAQSRDCFARGALSAARFLSQQSLPKRYTMRDMLKALAK